MRDISDKYKQWLAMVPPQISAELDLSCDISTRIDFLMRERGLSKKQLAEALGKRPCEVTRWLCGQHNFTISTLAMLSTFFGKPIITAVK